MKHESIVKMIILLGILLYTNPKRAELDSLLLNTFNHNFVKGVSKYLSVNLREAFRGDTSINCAFFSYLRSGRREFYVGIAGMWIEPHYWSTVSGWTTVTTVLLATLRIIKKKDLNEAITLFISVLFFIFFSEPTELKMGRNNMLVFVVTCTLFSLAVMRGTTHKYTGIRSLEEIPIHQIIRACGSACLCYLAIAASNPNEIFFIKGVVIQKHFRWNGLKMEYSQATFANILYQLSSLDYVGLVGTATGAIAQDVIRWLSD